MPDAEDLLPDSEFERLRGILRRSAIRTLAQSIGLVNDQLPLEFALGADILATSPEMQTLLDEAAERIVGIEEETMRRVRGYVGYAVDNDLSPSQLASRITRDPSNAFGRSRAMTIARTEPATIYNGGSLAGYEASGRVDHVKVHDNEGPNSCEECKLANGQIWTIEDAKSRVLEHPNCVRGFSPVVKRRAR